MLYGVMGDEKMSDLDARIPTTKRTRDRIRRLKVDSERYEEVLIRLLDEHENKIKERKQTHE